MCGVDEVCRLPDHGAIDPPPPLRLWLLRNAAAETNPELSHPEADEEAEAVSALSSDVSLRPSSCSVLPEQQTRPETDANTDRWFLSGKTAEELFSRHRAERSR